MHVEEPAAESFLYALWERGIAGNRFRTIDGRPVEILSPGQRNTDAGPDYRDAVIRLDGRVLRGDIEFHPLADDWTRHGHHLDPRYNNVVLHFVTSGCPPNTRTVRQDGAAVPIVDLDQHLPRPAEALENEGLVATGRVPENCWLGGQPPAVIARVVENAAHFRLAEKSARLREHRNNDTWDQIVYRALLEALGYAKNQTPARALADRLPLQALWVHASHYGDSEALAHIQAWLLGAAGFLDARVFPDAASERFARTMQRLWESYPDRSKISPLPLEAWTFFRLRPTNFPTRRLAAAAVLVVRFRHTGFLERFRRIVTVERTSQVGTRHVVRELERLLTVESYGFWNERDCFLTGKARTQNRTPHLLGKERARDAVVNVVLPALLGFADEINDGRLSSRVRELYHHYPRLPDNEILRQMQQQLPEAQRSGTPFPSTAAQQQGLIYLFKAGCTKANCKLCHELRNP